MAAIDAVLHMASSLRERSQRISEESYELWRMAASEALGDCGADTGCRPTELIFEIEIALRARRGVDEAVDLELELFSELMRNEIFVPAHTHAKWMRQFARQAFLEKTAPIDLPSQFLHFGHQTTSQVLPQSGPLSSAPTSRPSGLLSSLDFSVRLDLSADGTSPLAELLISNWPRQRFLYFFLFMCKMRSPACRIPARDQVEAKREPIDERR